MTRIPGLIWRPGPANKINAGQVQRKGSVLHSSEGMLAGAFAQLDGPAEVSWPCTIDTDGTGFQHYELETQCWHAHAVGNINYFGIEFPNLYTGGQPDHRPLTQAQVDKAIEVLTFVFNLWGLTGSRTIGKTLWEHNEVPGNSTACPSGRIPWDHIVAGLNPPVPVPVVFIAGDQSGGLEKRGHQIYLWNDGVPIFLFGNAEGGLAGQIAKNFGGDFWWLTKAWDGQADWQPNPSD